MDRCAWAQADAYGEWVCTIPPISGNSMYSRRWVGVSIDGRRAPSTTRPSSSATTTMSSAVSPAYAMPLGLMTRTPAARSTPLALPNDSVTSPAWSIARFAAATAALRSARPIAEPGFEGVNGGHHEVLTSLRGRIDEYDREPTIVRPASNRTLPRQEERS